MILLDFSQTLTIMDLLEPYDYGEIEAFNPKYMSGFLGEIYSDKAENFDERIKRKVNRDIEKVLDRHLKYYKVVKTIRKEINVEHKGAEFVLLPVWRYVYIYAGKEYEYYINGQSGKVIGKSPISIGKVVAFSSASFLVALIGALLLSFVLYSGMMGVEAYLISALFAFLASGIFMFVTWPRRGKVTTTERTFLATQRMNDVRDILKY